jgi:hypothetical protein
MGVDEPGPGRRARRAYWRSWQGRRGSAAQLVYDPFLGSGTSVIAAEMTGRTCIGIEIRPAYVDVILRRWQDFTGRTAIHQASGQSFNERAANRDRALSGAADA